MVELVIPPNPLLAKCQSFPTHGIVPPARFWQPTSKRTSTPFGVVALGGLIPHVTVPLRSTENEQVEGESEEHSGLDAWDVKVNVVEPEEVSP